MPARALRCMLRPGACQFVNDNVAGDRGERFGASAGSARSTHNVEDEMASLEQVEISRYHEELVHDVRHLVKKYGRIMGWEVPELDEAEASKLIFAALKQALADVEREHQ